MTTEIIVALVTAIILATNIVILATLYKSKTFTPSIKLHLGLITTCDSLTGLALSTRFFFNHYGNGIDLITCKILTGFASFMGAAMLCVNISMTVECLSAVVASGRLYNGTGCLHIKRWRLTRRGLLIAVSSVLISASIVIGFVIAPSPPIGEGIDTDKITCTMTLNYVYHTTAMYYWAGVTFILFNANIVLLIILIYYLHKNNKKSRALINQSNKPSSSGSNTLDTMSQDRTPSVSLINVRPVETTSNEMEPQPLYQRQSLSISSQNIRRPMITFSPSVMVMPIERRRSNRDSQIKQKPSCSYSRKNGAIYPATPMAQLNIPALQSEDIQDAMPLPTLSQKRKHGMRRRINAKARKRKSSVTLMILATCFFTLCYAPCIYTAALYVFCPNHCGLNPAILRAAAMVLVLHGLFNAAIYAAKDKHFRKVAVSMFKPRG